MYPELLDKHFNWYSTPDSWRKPAAGVARGAFRHPYHFDLFAARLQRLEARPTPPQLEVIARDIKDNALSVRVWFGGLDSNQRYFAMLACLCPALTLDELWKLYEKLVEFLKGQGIRLDPPLNYGREDLLESIQAHQTDAGTVEFNSPIFAQGALAQAQNNYREQFRLVLPKFVNEIETTLTDVVTRARLAGEPAWQGLTRLGEQSGVVWNALWKSTPSRPMRLDSMKVRSRWIEEMPMLSLIHI